MLWSSFEHHLPVDRLLDTAGDRFSGLLEANGIPWEAITDPAQRRDLILQVLAQVPVLWVWDNIEPVTGFPPGTRSAWTQAEQDDLAEFLRDLAQDPVQGAADLPPRRTHWLGDLPVRLDCRRCRCARPPARRRAGSPPRPGPGRSGLAAAAALHRGNPLTITVLVGQALREG